jgi:hypothetical protein
MVVLTWITPGCMQFLKNKKRFYTAWTRSGHSRAADLRYRKQADASPPAHPSGQKGAADPLAGVGVPPVVPQRKSVRGVRPLSVLPAFSAARMAHARHEPLAP